MGDNWSADIRGLTKPDITLHLAVFGAGTTARKPTKAHTRLSPLRMWDEVW